MKVVEGKTYVIIFHFKFNETRSDKDVLLPLTNCLFNICTCLILAVSYSYLPLNLFPYAKNKGGRNKKKDQYVFYIVSK
jgi:hypothetical protein